MFQKLATWLCVGAIFAACSGGPGTPITPGPSSDRASTGPEGATGGVDPGQCLPCAGSYVCTGTLQGQGVNGDVVLLSSAASCPISGQNQKSIFLACGGTIESGDQASGVPAGAVVGTWKDIGGGVVVACFGVLGSENCITCSPGVEQTDQPTAGGSDAGIRKNGDAGQSGSDAGQLGVDGG